jgi:hypothetical protein
MRDTRGEPEQQRAGDRFAAVLDHLGEDRKVENAVSLEMARRLRNAR